MEKEQNRDLNNAVLEDWLKTFTQTYFQHTSTYITAFQVAHENYLKQVANWFDDVKFAGVAVEGQEVDKADKLVSIFVMPDVQEEVQKRDRFFGTWTDELNVEAGENWRQAALLYEQRARASFDRTGRKFLAQQLLQQNRSKVVILGAPGSGKTTLLRYFAVKLAIGEATDLGLKDADWLPILIPIRDWALRPELGVLEFVRWFAEKRMTVKGVPTGFFEYWLDRGRALILLDGLDEVADEAKRYDMVQRIENFLGQYDQNRAIVSSRPAGYKRDFFRTEEFPHYELLAFDDAKVETFIQHWYDSRIKDPTEAERKKESLRKALNQHDRIKVLARNPLLLTIVALIHRYQARLPRERFRLYDIAVKTLIESWDSNKELTEKSVLKYLDLSDLRRLMEMLAYWIHTQGNMGDTEGGTLIDKDELLDWLTKAIRKQKQLELYQAKEEAKQFLKFVRERTGLLNEQGQDCYAFVHKTFQEYLCAQEINYQADNEDDFEIVLSHVREHLHDPHWREVLLLLIAQQKPKKVAKAIRTVLEQQSQYEQWLHRDLFFAGECLAEDPKDLKGADSALVEEILDRLVALEVSRSPEITGKTRQRVFWTLCYFNETTLQLDLLQRLKSQSEQIGVERLQGYRIELGEREIALERLLEEIETKRLRVSNSFANALSGRLHKSYTDVAERLASLIAHEDAEVRLKSTLALSRLWSNSNLALKYIQPLLYSEDRRIRNIGAYTIGELSIIPAQQTIHELLNLLNDPEAWVRASAALSLAKLGETSEKVFQNLLPLLTYPTDFEGIEAAIWAGRIANSSNLLLEQLLTMAQDEDPDIRASIATALGHVSHKLEQVIQALLLLLGDEDNTVRYNAAYALGELNESSELVIEKLLQRLPHDSPDFGVLEDESPSVRSAVALALVKLGYSSQELIDELFTLLQHTGFSIGLQASRALGILGRKNNSITSRLIEWIEQNRDSNYVGNGIDALWEIIES